MSYRCKYQLSDAEKDLFFEPICRMPITDMYDLKRSLDDEVSRIKFNFFFRNAYLFDRFYVFKVPGRVNLIGEHVDYSGYGVIPMAVEYYVELIVKATLHLRGGKVTLTNMDPKYEPAILDTPPSWPTGTPSWYHYIQCGLYSDSSPNGMDILVHSTIPPNAGLSSSSALVCAAAMCTYATNDKDLPSRIEMAELCAKAERRIGTQGGGMDQAIAFLGKSGFAKHIEFNPLRCEDVRLPSEAVFIIANSLVEKNKAASNDFNMRVIECRLAAQVIGKKNGLDWRKIKKLKDLQDEIKLNIQEMVELNESNLEERAYTKEEIADILEIPVEELVEFSMSPDTKDEELFYLKKRARHVFTEVIRVDRFKTSEMRHPTEEGWIEELGALMSESHQSLKDNFECSHPKLDKLVEISKQYTLGAKLTGAGWGGCIVALTTKEKESEYKKALKEQFYPELNENDFRAAVFSSRPAQGASIQRFQNFRTMRCDNLESPPRKEWNKENSEE